MEIITANQAREMIDKYNRCNLNDTIKYVMKEIKDLAKYGMNNVDFNNMFPTRYDHFEQIKTKEFKEYIESLGYKYEFSSRINIGFYSEHIIISW